ALKLRNRSNIHFNFVGDGRKRKWVEEFIENKNLSDSVHCWGQYPLSAMPSFFNQADILFLSLKKSPIFELTVPAKLQAYMSSGKPVVSMIDGEGAAVIAEADCGWSVPAESPEKLAELLIELSNTDSSILAQKGANGKAFSHKHYGFDSCMDHLCSMLASER
ncbi:MAG: glycosyltransferase, partial [Alistipes sp.]|nr:glycosyltransferase [Alistipes sp.]